MYVVSCHVLIKNLCSLVQLENCMDADKMCNVLLYLRHQCNATLLSKCNVILILASLTNKSELKNANN